MLYNSHFKFFPGKLRSKWEGPYEVDEAYPSGAVKLMGKTSSSWIINGQCLKHYRAYEVNTIENLYYLSEEEIIEFLHAKKKD